MVFKQLKKLWKNILSIFLFSSYLEVAHAAIIKQESLCDKMPTNACHASTLTECNSGSLVCAWFGGSEEGEKDVAIWSSSLQTDSWSELKKIAEANEVACWNPVLFTFPSNELLLFYKVGKSPQSWSGVLKRSFDEGKTWSEPEELPAGIIGPAKNKPLLLKNGTLLCGTSVESWKRWGCFIDTTSDQGRTWSRSDPINLKNNLYGIIQPTIFPSINRAIKLLARSNKVGVICSATSLDQGKTWSAATPTILPNPNSGIDAVTLADSRVVLAYNPTSNVKERYPLSIAVSKDGGETWEKKMDLEISPGEYSYPAIIQTKDGKIHITYTWNCKKIKHVVLDPHHLF